MDITTATPVEIDTALAEIYTRYYAAVREVNTQERYLEDAQDTLAQVDAGTYRYSWSAQYDRPRYETRIADLTTKVEALREKAREILKETAPFNAEFIRRGGWNRAWLVDNASGHVHNTMGCSTCYITTQFTWLPEFSGHEESEIVEAAGEKACTVCYPTAPVDVLKRKSTIEAPARRAARLEREAAKRERDAKKAAKAIANPDGSPLTVFRFHFSERIVRDRNGEQVIPAHDTFETLETLHAAKAFLTDSQEAYYGSSKRPEDVQRVAEAIAHKLGTDVATEIEAAKKRASKRR